MSTAGDPDIKALLGEIKTLREDFARMGGVVEDLVRHRANRAADEVGRRAERAWDGVNSAAGEASRAMEDNPIAAVGGAFGLGLLVGMLFSRR